MFITDKFTKVLREQQKERMKKDEEKKRLALADPFDSEAQRRIAEEIRSENCFSSLMEHNLEHKNYKIY